MSEQESQPDYFTFYDLPVQFYPDQSVIKAKFYSLSKQYHPDFYASESQEKQDEVLTLSTLNNKAYQILSNTRKRIKYVLELKGIIASDEGYQLPQSFLMDMMDVNEVLMDLQFEPDEAKLTQVREEVNTIEKQLTEEMDGLMLQFDQNPQGADQLFPVMKDNFYRQKYIDRIREKLP